MKVQSKTKTKQKLSDVINYFIELPFYNTYIEKPQIKRLRNIDLFCQLLFYEKLSVVKRDKAFRGYGMTYKVELNDKKDTLSQLEARE